MTATATRHTIIALIASICHEANRQYCRAFMSDDSQPAYVEAPAWQVDSAFKGVEAIADGRVTKPSQSHDSWLAEKAADGWQYGAVKDVEHKLHPCFVPYEQLPELQRHKDALFFAIASSLLYAFGCKAPSNIVELPVADEPILRFFAFSHLPPMLQNVSQPFAALAGEIVKTPRSAERTVALRKLLESKDAAVRASLPA
jgi:hypothetical protein